ncbi:RNA polymerase sigma factor [Haliangium sp.]|uniref:RNA polymerase sigma factor n=1 Tax=Haliangium sp. TaxID=2663208 RepID=UPI003D123912
MSRPALELVRAPSDLDLAHRCAAGERAAQNRLFDQYIDLVHATLYRILGSNHEIEDLVQEAFFQVFRSLPNFRGESKLSTWICRITTRAAFAYLQRKRPMSVHLEAVPDLASSDPSAMRQVMARQAIRRLYALLDELDPKQRIAFALHVLDGRPMNEVAKLTEATVVATKSRVLRARRKVRKDPVVAAFLDAPDFEEAD